MADYQLSQIAIMHHLNGLSQQEIANLLGLSKMTVSRILQKAKDKGIVRTEVKLPFDVDTVLENKLKKAYNLADARVVKPSKKDKNDGSVQEEVAKAAAFFFNTFLPSDATVGIGVGRTIGLTIHHLYEMKSNNLHIVQLMGGLPEVASENPFTIIQETCRKLQADGTFLTSFAAAESEKERENFINNSENGEMVFKLWKKCDLALFGVGMIENGTILSPKLISSDEMEELKEASAIGDVLGHCFTESGEPVNSSIEKRLVSIPVELFRNIKVRRAVAFGEKKAPAIRGALKAGLVTELVTDDKTAGVLTDSV